MTTLRRAPAMVAGLMLASSPAALLAQASPSAYTSGVRYDNLGRVTGTIAPDPDGAGPLQYLATRISYNPRGQVTTVETGELSSWRSEAIAPAAWGSAFTVFTTMESTWDVNGRKVADSFKGSDLVQTSYTQFGYDYLGRLQCTAVRMNPAAWTSQPDACLLGSTGTNGPDRISRTMYDAAGQVLQERKAVGTAVEKADATFAYTNNGKKRAVVDGNGNRAELSYDGYDRQARWSFPAAARPSGYNDATPASALATAGTANLNDFETYDYDANGNRTLLKKRDGSRLTFSYDTLNRMMTKLVPVRSGLANIHTRNVYYGYDLRGLQIYSRFDSVNGEGITNSWDGFGAQTSSLTNMGGQARTLSYQSDRNGNRTRLTYPDGNFVTFAFDGLNRQVTMYENGGSQLLYRTFDKRGNPTIMGRRYGDHTTASYDPVSRLASYTHNFVAGVGNVTTSMSYTPASQIAQRIRSNDLYLWKGHVNVDRGYVTNGLNQYTSTGGQALGYDANGNLTSEPGIAYLYDVENRLVQASGSRSAQLRYDPLGRLYETNGGSAGPTRFVYDGDELVAEYDAAGTMLKRYVHGSGSDDPLVWYEGAYFTSAAARYLYADHQGSVMAVSGSNGALFAVNSYDEYGIPSATNQGRFQYTGQAWLPELGMYHYKARVYSPTLGRFLQTDPIGYEGGKNLYVYVGGDPLNKSDPSGLRDVDIYRDRVIITQYYKNNTGGVFSNAQIEDEAHRLNSTTSDGRSVIVQAQERVLNPDVTFTIDPSKNAYVEGLTSTTNRIGGDQIDLAPNESGPAVLGHELGHSVGAGDQYVRGIDANGNRLSSAVPGPENIMRDPDAGVGANSQTADEIVNYVTHNPTGPVRSCTVSILTTSCDGG